MQTPGFAITLTAALIAGSTLSLSTHAQIKRLETVEVLAPQLDPGQAAVNEGKLSQPDLAQWLEQAPGAAVNRNGPVTGIAQVRGHYGDRVAVSIDGQQMVSAGPNAMDAPLSYATPLLAQKLSLYRGIAPVSSAIDSLGGSVKVSSRRAEPGENTGLLSVGGRSNNQASNIGALYNLASTNYAAQIYASAEQGDDYSSGADQEISPSAYDKKQAGLDLRRESGASELGLAYNYVDTNDSGTPALPMDIDYIEASRLGFDGKQALTNWELSWQLSGMSAEHTMDNYQQRPAMPMMSRSTFAESDSAGFQLQLQSEHWNFGVDAIQAEHSATVTSPENNMFKVVNFNDVEDQRIGAFVEYERAMTQASTLHMGIRAKQSSADAGNVSHHMYGQNDAITLLVDRFNNAERSKNDVSYDALVSTQHQLKQNLALYLGLALKTRAPSYQQRYLWIPMQATGGLADGKVYVGDLKLKHEKAAQFDLGLSYQTERFSISPHIFYQKIDNYIQGVAASDMTVNMVAQMMTGGPALQFANVDASLYGADLSYVYQITQRWSLDGIAAYVKGERDDVDDYLYRIAPPSATANINYQRASWRASVGARAVAAQNDVSSINDEPKTAGYAVFDMSLDVQLNAALALRLGLDNVFDKNYAKHLGGVNRVAQSDIAVGQRLPEQGRNAWLELDWHF
ncbi:TonB-dependent receptor [Agaribacterium haliotis]|uniref:TonB-dependent receptor n=1 Tax=Agaribacterium haliotis TaxID=2013869 RepID=UPI0013042BAC|nr:TonB-dependent receptor [Agaribacterium haliotis]